MIMELAYTLVYEEVKDFITLVHGEQTICKIVGECSIHSGG
jgi:hypothetical protein